MRTNMYVPMPAHMPAHINKHISEHMSIVGDPVHRALLNAITIKKCQELNSTMKAILVNLLDYVLSLHAGSPKKPGPQNSAPAKCL